MTKNESHRILKETGKLNPGRWINHAVTFSLGVVQQPPIGLLHDIGRKFGVTKIRHGLDGYRFLIGRQHEEQDVQDLN